MAKEGSIMKTYVLKLYHLFQYLGYSDNQLINLIANLRENKYSDAYKLYHQLDEFQLVKYKQLAEGPIAYTECKDLACAIQRFKDEIIPLSPIGVNTKVDQKLLSAMIDTNTQTASTEIQRQLVY